jgi:tRNA G37 N-methylase Trm5
MIRLIQLIKLPENNLILDPFAGSGSTLVACKLLGIDFIGIEINPEYHKIATKRLNENIDKSFLLEILNPTQKENITTKDPQNIESYAKRLSNLFQKIYLSLLLNNQTNDTENNETNKDEKNKDETNNDKLYSLNHTPPANKKSKPQSTQLNLL